MLLHILFGHLNGLSSDGLNHLNDFHEHSLDQYIGLSTWCRCVRALYKRCAKFCAQKRRLREKIPKKTYAHDMAMVFNAPSETWGTHCCDNLVAALAHFFYQFGQKSLPFTLKFDSWWVDFTESDMSEQDIGISDS
jgi:hypothetical protein